VSRTSPIDGRFVRRLETDCGCDLSCNGGLTKGRGDRDNQEFVKKVTKLPPLLVTSRKRQSICPACCEACARVEQVDGGV
jgi:hypothetical protein